MNVYRLITRGTLEEKIMGLQKFKMSIANTVISQDNASMQSMGTDQLLNLFTLDKVRPPSVSVMETQKLMSMVLNLSCQPSRLLHCGTSLLLARIHACCAAMPRGTCIMCG